MKISKIVLVAALCVSATSVLAEKKNLGAAFKRSESVNLPGFVSHGINVYNGERISDFNGIAPNVPFLAASNGVLEIAVFQEGAESSAAILAGTDRNLPVATTRELLDFFNPGGEVNPSTLNVPLDRIGSNFFGYTAPDDRVVPTAFPSLGTAPSIYHQKGAVLRPTVGDWEKISGLVTVQRTKNGLGSRVTLTIRNAFPKAVYTVWDVGVRNPLSATEDGYVVPLGGLPNIILTDENGCGTRSVELSYDLLRECKAGVDSCTAYVAGFYHWDNQGQGASPGGSFVRIPEGVYAGNQMVWPVSGETLIEPQTSFSPRRHGCY